MDLEKIKDKFVAVGGDENNGFPFIDAAVYRTDLMLAHIWRYIIEINE